MVRYLWGLFALVLCAPGVGLAQLCGATCLDLETLGAATVYDQETGASTMYDSCTYTDCTCIGDDVESDPSWVCCNVSTQHGWGSFGEGCVSYAAGEVIVYGTEGSAPAPIPEPGDLSWSLLDWLGDLLLVDWSTEPDLREVTDHSDHGGIILVDLWPEWQAPREGRPTLSEVSALLEAWGMFDTEDSTDGEATPTLEDPSEFVEHNPLGTECRLLYQAEWRGGSPLQTEDDDPTPSETPTAGQVEATPEPLPCPPGTTPAFGGLLCLGYWTPGGDWREVEHGTPCGQEGEPACPGAPHPQQEPCEPAKEPCASGCCWPIGHTPDGDDGGWDAPLPREVPAGYEGPWRR